MVSKSIVSQLCTPAFAGCVHGLTKRFSRAAHTPQTDTRPIDLNEQGKPSMRQRAGRLGRTTVLGLMCAIGASHAALANQCTEYDLESFTLPAPFTSPTSCTTGIWFDNNPVFYVGEPDSLCFDSGGQGTATDNTTGSTTDGTILGVQAGPGNDFLPAVQFSATVTPNTDYELNFANMIWARSDFPTVDYRGAVRVYVNGVLHDTVLGTPGLGFAVWEDYSSVINTGANTTMNFELHIKRGLNNLGNDYMFDDINFRTVGNQFCGVETDFGDAPVSGPSPDTAGTNAYGEASHTIMSGIYLGAGVPDAEAANQPNGTATGDDADGQNDDDGITIPQLTKGQSTTITASVSGAGGFLQGWIDWDGNGAFGAGEQVASNLVDGNGDGVITFSVTPPAATVINPTFARFRWSTTANLDSAIPATDGEVEDYRVTILPTSQPVPPLDGVCNFDRTDGSGSKVELYDTSPANTGDFSVDIGDNASESVSGYNEIILTYTELTNERGGPLADARVMLRHAGFWSQTHLNRNDFLFDYDEALQGWVNTADDGDDILIRVLSATVDGVAVPIEMMPYEANGTPEESGYHLRGSSNTLDRTITDGGTGVTYSDTVTLTTPANIPSVVLGPMADGEVLENVVVTFAVIFEDGRDAFVDHPDTGTDDVDRSTNFNSLRVGLAFDYGDAPSGYPDAAHDVNPCAPPLYLGANRPDVEVTARASADALGESAGDSDDEDGVTIPALQSGTTVAIPVTVAGAGGYLQGWVDWNGNQTFEAGEQIAANLQDNGAGSDTTAGDGIINLNVTVPVTATLGQSFARFRWSTTSGLDSTTTAPDGEVEDYAVTVNAVSTSSPVPSGIVGDDVAFCAPDQNLMTNGSVEDHGVSPGTFTYVLSPNRDGATAVPLPGWSFTGSAGNYIFTTNFVGRAVTSAFPDGSRALYMGNNFGEVPATENWETTIRINADGTVDVPEGFSLVVNEQGLSTPKVPTTATTTISGLTPGVEYQFEFWVSGEPGYDYDGLAMVTVDGTDHYFSMPAKADGSGLRITDGATSTIGTSQRYHVPFTAAATSAEITYTNWGHFFFFDGNRATSELIIDDMRFCPADPLVDRSDSPADGSAAPVGGTTSYGEATHMVVSGVQLGGTITPDTSAVAGADDASDDGVTFPTLTQGFSADIPVTVAQASANDGYLQGWIDWNGNGDFADPGEQIALDVQSATAGTSVITVNVNVPSNATVNDTYARFRWSTTSGLDSTTAASDGEVEDYLVSINSHTVASVGLGNCSTGVAPWTVEWIDRANSNYSSPLAGSTPQVAISTPKLAGAWVDAPAGSDWITYNFLGANNALGDHADADYDNNVNEGSAVNPVAVGTNDFVALRYKLNVNLPDPAGVVLEGLGSVDNSVYSITVNGTPNTSTFANFNSLQAISLSSGWVAGNNELIIDVASGPNLVGLVLGDCVITRRDYSDAVADGGNAPNGTAGATAYGVASHTIDTSIRLGANVTGELGSAQGADNASDDGVTFPALVIGGTDTITVSTVGSGGFLQAWIDWDGSGAFDDPVEQIATDLQDFGTGTISIPITVPSYATTNPTVARFRWSTDFSIGPDGGARDGEVEDYQITLGGSGAALAGRVFLDNGSGATAYDAVQGGLEAGTTQASVSLFDGSSALLATVPVNGDGTWSYVLPPSYTGAVTVMATPAPGLITVSEQTAGLPSLSNSDPHDGTFTFTPVSGTTYSALDIGLLPLPSLTQDQSTSIVAGQVVTLTHRYEATGPASVSFALTDIVQNPVGAFTSTIYRDVSCDGTLDTVVGGPITVVAGESVCLGVRTQAASGAGPGAALTYGLTANTSFTGTSVVTALRNDDRIGSGGEELLLRKLVTNLSIPGSTEGTSNIGNIGDTLRYRIVFTNPGNAPANDILVSDATPAYTALASPIPPSVTVAPGITCGLQVPASGNVTGYVGPLQWQCPGVFPPGAQGSVTFEVQISP
jgi:uncharacterized repeat protein (TIGR01451 family)